MVFDWLKIEDSSATATPPGSAGVRLDHNRVVLDFFPFFLFVILAVYGVYGGLVRVMAYLNVIIY